LTEKTGDPYVALMLSKKPAEIAAGNVHRRSSEENGHWCMIVLQECMTGGESARPGNAIGRMDPEESVSD
jgi:hypothetical protein